MGIVTANQFQLSPDISGSLSRGLNLGEQFRNVQLKRKQEEFLQGVDGRGVSDPNAIDNAAKLGLDFQKQVAAGLGLQDKRTGEINQKRLVEAANFAFKAENLPIEQQNIAINNRIQEVEGRGGDATESRQLLGIPFEDRRQAFQIAQLAALPNDQRIKILQGGGQAKIQFGGQESFKDDRGNVFFATSKRNPQTGNVESVVTPLVEGTQVQGQLKPLSGSGLTSSEKVAEAQQIANVKFTEKRRDAITSELSEKNRTASRSVVAVNAALKLTEKASQGLTGSVKLQLAKIFPGIDVADEGGLESAFTQLALVQLQNFKGPTTDFEFNKAQSVGGDLGDAKSANQARLNGLKRAAWFVKREFKQFREFTGKGGDPDGFAFDFSEKVQTGKGLISLEDLQDTAAENNLTIEQTLKRLNQ